MMKKSTQELLESMKSGKDYKTYLTENRENIAATHMKIDRALHILLAESGMRKADVIAKSGIETHYAYQLFAGTRVPTRDKVIMLCIGFSLSTAETMRIMKITGYAPLYAKNERDNAILFGITRRLSLIDLNDLLYELDLDILV